MPALDLTPKIGINGFGRIGRAVFRASLDRTDLEVVAINHTAPNLEYLLHVIRYDSTHGMCKHADSLSVDSEGNLLVGGTGRKIKLFSQRDPALIDWESAGVEYVVESTGKMLTTELASAHITLGKAKKVVISAPSKDAKTIVVGVNRKDYTTNMNVISNASCTTNCLAPLAKILERTFGIETGMLTTVHASTSSQHILDGYSKKSRRLGRAVGGNIIPTTTGAAKAVQLVMPELTGKFTGISIRVPVQNVSVVDLVVTLKSPCASLEDLLAPIREASKHPRLGAVICVNDDELVSGDFLGWQQSCIVNSAACVRLNDTTFKVIAWYDNEWAYSVRCLDLILHMSSVDHPPVVMASSAAPAAAV